MQFITKYGKYLLIPFIPLFIVIFSYIINAIFNVGVYMGTIVRILASMC